MCGEKSQKWMVNGKSSGRSPGSDFMELRVYVPYVWPYFGGIFPETKAIDNNPYINGISTSFLNRFRGLDTWDVNTWGMVWCWAGYPATLKLPSKNHFQSHVFKSLSGPETKKHKNLMLNINGLFFLDSHTAVWSSHLTLLWIPMLSSVNHGFGPKIITNPMQTLQECSLIRPGGPVASKRRKSHNLFWWGHLDSNWT